MFPYIRVKEMSVGWQNSTNYIHSFLSPINFPSSFSEEIKFKF